MFTPDDIRQRVRSQPFVPFRVVTSSGEAIEVFHPDLVMIGRREIHVGRPSARRPEFYDGVSRIAIMHITAMEDLPRRSGSRGDGRGRS